MVYAGRLSETDLAVPPKSLQSALKSSVPSVQYPEAEDRSLLHLGLKTRIPAKLFANQETTPVNSPTVVMADILTQLQTCLDQVHVGPFPPLITKPN